MVLLDITFKLYFGLTNRASILNTQNTPTLLDKYVAYPSTILREILIFMKALRIKVNLFYAHPSLKLITLR